MSAPRKYWVSDHEGIPKETLTIFNEYLLSLKLENKAEATIIKYRNVLRGFLSECTIPLKELTAEIVLKWLNVNSTNKKAGTIIHTHATLTSFFNFCLEEGYMDDVVIKKRWRPKLPHSLPQFLNEQDYTRVKIASELLSARDRAIVLFLFSSGCRRSEVSGLTLKDIDLGKRTAKVTGKGNKSRQVHFSDECAYALKEYLKIRKKNDSEYLFISRFGGGLGTKGIYDITIELGIKAGLNKSLNPHSCRHTFATRMLAKGASLEFIADELGHTNLNTTRVYAQIPSEDIIAAYLNKMG
ncbi:tyrosine-type recombinase/integrase [Sporosarcina sp. FSL W7-1283]|uniref:tyrosine-type recombinase/integrase n=1 Tax=Sporosarcina sp. FSL W7-1283 TaxID=2921560 RepID=UPI0030F9DF08